MILKYLWYGLVYPFQILPDISSISWRWNIVALGINAVPADALVPKVGRASAGMVLAVQDRHRQFLIKEQKLYLWTYGSPVVTCVWWLKGYLP